MADDVLGFPHDHETIAWSHFLAQHLGKAYTEAFVTAFYPPLNVLDKAQNDLYTLRWLETAVGVQLDGIGSIVGQSRDIPQSVYLPFFGFSSQESGTGFNQARLRHEREPYATTGTMGDQAYRMAIITKIGINNSHGTAEDIMAACNGVLGVENTVVYDLGNANASVYVNDLQLLPGDYRATIIDTFMPKAGGVKIWPYVYDTTQTFGFLNQQIYFGFGIGILARSVMSNGGSPVPIQPTLDMNFMSQDSLDSRIIFTRSTTATYTDVNGLIQTAAINAPRWDYDPITHALKGVLLEDARTNLALRSGDFTSASWGKGSCTISAGITCPTGVVGGSGMVSNAGVIGYLSQNINVTASSIYTQSVFIKAGTTSSALLLMAGSMWSDALNRSATFNLATGVVSSVAGGTATATIQNVGNGWYRCSLIATPDNTMLGNFQFARTAANGDGVAIQHYVWGAQLEVGPFSTSYIPTTTAAVARSGDNCRVPVGSWYDITRGAMFIEYILKGAINYYNAPMQLVGSNSSIDYLSNVSTTVGGAPVGTAINPNISGAENSVAGVTQGNALFRSSPAIPITSNVIHKAATSWGLNAIMNTSHDGLAPITRSSGVIQIVPTIVNLTIAGPMHYQIQQALWVRTAKYFPYNFSQVDLQTMTT